MSIDPPPPITPHEGRIERSLSPEVDFLVERHVPRPFREPYHHHASVELNYLDGMSMTYAVHGAKVAIPERRLVVFWATAPHKVVRTAGDGTITNIYLKLEHILRSGPGDALLDALLGGAILCARSAAPSDGAWVARLSSERGNTDPAWRRLHLAEIDARLKRLALEGWDVLHDPSNGPGRDDRTIRSLVHVERMLRFVSENFSGDISVSEVTACTDLSQSHASAVFRALTRHSIKQHIDRTRLSHAWILLTETDLKVSTIAMDAGYRSLSSFYSSMMRTYGMTPGEVRRSSG